MGDSHHSCCKNARPGSKSGFAGGPAAVGMPMDGQKWDVDIPEGYIYLHLVDFYGK